MNNSTFRKYYGSENKQNYRKTYESLTLYEQIIINK
jgi:hypothetical protein